jgi:hypothetical protein
MGKYLCEGRERSIGFRGFGCLWAHVLALDLGLLFLKFVTLFDWY